MDWTKLIETVFDVVTPHLPVGLRLFARILRRLALEYVANNAAAIHYPDGLGAAPPAVKEILTYLFKQIENYVAGVSATLATMVGLFAKFVIDNFADKIWDKYMGAEGVGFQATPVGDAQIKAEVTKLETEVSAAVA